MIVQSANLFDYHKIVKSFTEGAYCPLHERREMPALLSEEYGLIAGYKKKVIPARQDTTAVVHKEENVH